LGIIERNYRNGTGVPNEVSRQCRAFKLEVLGDDVPDSTFERQVNFLSWEFDR
jgi:hypothetical protein